MRRCIAAPRLAILVALLAAMVVGVRPVAAAPTLEHDHGDAALARIESDRAEGRIDDAEALRLRLLRVFEPDSLPAGYRSLADRPLSCATSLLRDAVAEAQELPELRDRVRAWMQPRSVLGRALTHLSPQGRFQISYETSGTNAVPLDDVAPANGVPDFVERIGQYLEQSWSIQFEQLGFVAPDVSQEPYPIGFQNMGAYGYTTDQLAGAAGTRIVLNNDFVGFPPNDDPEGDQIGAMKVTCVHELRHASQFVTSGWSEPGLWVEVDATWIEDIGFDGVNDYYNYLSSGSPISNPTLPLDAGGSGSYEDCVWQHFLVERWSLGVMQKFWLRRGTGVVEDVMLSYDWAMQQFGGSVLENFLDFAMWNLQTGTRSAPAVGYEEAAGYPTSPVTDGATSLPATFTSAIQRYAARFYRVTGFTTGEYGAVQLTLNRAVDSPLRARAVVVRPDGSRVLEPLVLTGAQDVFELATPLQDVAELYVVVAHGGIGLGTATLTLDVAEIIRPPEPAARVDLPTVNFRIATGTIRSRGFNLRNVGQPGSVLDFQAHAAHTPAPLARTTIAPGLPGDADPATANAKTVVDGPRRDISGSFVSIDVAGFTPGSTVTRTFTVGNASRDFEWLAGVEITFPAGVTVLGSTDFLGGADGPLVTDGTTGDGVTVTWSDLNGSWGNVRNGQAATATVDLAFDVTLVGDLVVSYRILGDGYGADPHEVQGALLLDGPDAPVFELRAPAQGAALVTGETARIEWIAGFTDPLTIELSRDAGATWEVLADSVANTGSFDWAVTGSGSDDARIRLTRVGTSTSVESGAIYVLEHLSWTSVVPATGSVPAAAEATLEIVFDATALAPGVYEAELFVFHNGPSSPLRFPITLEVTETSTPADPGRTRYRMLGVAPNPFNPVTSVMFELFETSHVRVEIFDVRGRRVRELVDTELLAGPHAIRWDSHDDDGNPVSSGVYHYVLGVDDRRETGKITLAK